MFNSSEKVRREKSMQCFFLTENFRFSLLADLTVSKRPGTSNRIEIHFAVFNHLYLCFSFVKLAETL